MASSSSSSHWSHGQSDHRLTLTSAKYGIRSPRIWCPVLHIHVIPTHLSIKYTQSDDEKSKILVYNYCLIYLYWIYMLIIPPDAYLGSKLVPNSSFNCKHCPTIFCFQSEQFLSTTVWQHFNFQSWTNWQKAASTPCHVVPQQEVWKVKTAKFISQGRHFFPRQLSVFSEDFICHLQWVQHIYLLKEVVFADGVSF